jgi:hypothetical protein
LSLEPAPTLPFWRVMSLILSFAFGCAVSVVLWTFWMPRCDEGCTPSAVVSLLVFLALFPVLCTGAMAAVQATRWRLGVRAAVLGAVAVLCAGFVLHLVKIAVPSDAVPSAKAAGLR